MSGKCDRIDSILNMVMMIVSVIFIICIINVGVLIYNNNELSNGSSACMSSSTLSEEIHTITNINMYVSTSTTEATEKYLPYTFDSDNKISYEVELDTGEIIGTGADGLELNKKCVMFIHKVNWNGEDIAWFENYYINGDI